MILDNIGYVICEGTPVEPSKTTIVNENYKGTGKLVGRGILQTANERNRNGRYYEDNQLFPQLTAPRTTELLNCGFMRAEMGHPLDTSLARQSQIRQDLCCARFLKFWTEGDNVWGEFVATNNKYGEEFNADMAENLHGAWSLRALGEIVQVPHKGACVRNLRLITYDSVIYPSHPGAYTQEIIGIGESTGVNNEPKLIIESESGSNIIQNESVVVPFDSKDIINFIQQESANIKFIKDLFDFKYNNITVNESNTKVSLTDKETGDTMIINIESYIHNEIANSLFNYDIC